MLCFRIFLNIENGEKVNYGKKFFWMDYIMLWKCDEWIKLFEIFFIEI